MGLPRQPRRKEIRCFQEVSEYAAERGILVGLQNHPSTGDDILRILRETDRENFTFILDTGQWGSLMLLIATLPGDEGSALARPLSGGAEAMPTATIPLSISRLSILPFL